MIDYCPCDHCNGIYPELDGPLMPPCDTCKDTGRVMWRIDSGPDAGMRQWGDCPDCKS